MLYVSSYLGNENFKNFVKVGGLMEHIPRSAGPCPFAGSDVNTTTLWQYVDDETWGFEVADDNEVALIGDHQGLSKMRM